MNKKITEMFAFVAEDNGEGVMGAMTNSGIMMPLVGADMARVTSLYPWAMRIKETTGKPFKILKFSTREDITEQVKKEMGK